MTDKQEMFDEPDSIMRLTDLLTAAFAEASRINGSQIGFALIVFHNQANATQCMQTSNAPLSVVRRILQNFLVSTKDLKDEDVARHVKVNLNS